ncbi:thiamine monophosphate kinase [Campylobacter blaseri]|uniref:Thiamine-monophosphate kinase n=1 Tax=Campylobacter blaseri TaxID=2042961 RepID=A0A2P8QZJ1_9BACT|nr:thiamine-phosphate kinase [Campylobacter blaseri]PSM51664.1 thiamine-phosphate kinase [Campylobacter blaseri]PSM53454.1 thiamine-phosphate kinase [Campylobacter blaseri]QKF86259.1 thiamine monophosphate kinase [Campylobacter blaseri]
MDKEKFIISKFQNKFIGDDGAVVGSYVYSKDLFIENSHFKKEWLSFYEIGRKAMMVNISDAIVMNAYPKYALIGLMLPKNTSLSDIVELNKGIKDSCLKYGIEIIGGDTISSNLIGLSVTIIAKTKRPIYRKALKDGEILAFTGNLGGSLKGLKALLNGGKIGKNSRFKNIILRDKFFYKASRYINSAMDISDGLKSDLPKFLKNKDIKLRYNFNKFEFNSGEEYEILFSCYKKNIKALKNIAKKTRTKVTFFAEVKRGRYRKYGKSEHF